MIDLGSPARARSGFCGDDADLLSVQQILWESAKHVHGSKVDLCGMSDDSLPNSPASKKSKLTESLEELLDEQVEDENVFGYSCDLDSA